jgi:DNA helicase II / ATP-dependent DNA helicase PcrA
MLFSNDLNPAQRLAVSHGDGPLLIVAGAGTGKTKTLVTRVAHLIDSGVSPSRILLLTFTRRAADEMLSRVAKLTSVSLCSRVWGGTFHAIGNRLLRTHGRAVGLLPSFTVMDESDAADLMNLVRSELGLADKDRRFPRKETLVKIYSHTVNALKPLSEIVHKHYPWCADDLDAMRELFDVFTRRKHEQSLLDYDDLLLYWGALCASPSVGKMLAGQFDHILVDEYQDTNCIQAEILVGMRKGNANITVVGDDAQSIYSFRAATVRNILDFSVHFPGAAVVTLEQNYRSTQPILAASNAVMACARERYTKELWSDRPSEQKPALFTCVDEAEQTEAVCRNILEHLERGKPLMRQAVLFRAGHHSASLEIELARRNIPFHKYGGLKFIEAAHIKDMLAFLRLLQNPFDEISWFRVLLMLEGVGPKTARRIMDELGVRRVTGAGSAGNGTTSGITSHPLARLYAATVQVPSAVKTQMAELRCALAYCHGITVPREGFTDPAAIITLDDQPDDGDAPRSNEPALQLQIERIRKVYEPLFQRLYDNATVRVRDLDQLAHIATRYRSRARFIADLTLDPPRATSDIAQPPFLEEDYLVLSTIHSAKGCEWDVVHIIHAADGMMPSDMAVADEAGIDEERRLFYVAMTRAKDMLYVYFPLRYYHHRFGLGDAHNYAQLTRFLPLPARALFAEETASNPIEDDSDSAVVRGRDPHSRVSSLFLS